MTNEQKTRLQAEKCATRDYCNGISKDATRYNAAIGGAWAEWYNSAYDKLIESREAVAPVDQSEEQ